KPVNMKIASAMRAIVPRGCRFSYRTTLGHFPRVKTFTVARGEAPYPVCRIDVDNLGILRPGKHCADGLRNVVRSPWSIGTGVPELLDVSPFHRCEGQAAFGRKFAIDR